MAFQTNLVASISNLNEFQRFNRFCSDRRVTPEWVIYGRLCLTPRQARLNQSSRCEVTFGWAPGHETWGERGRGVCLFWKPVWETVAFEWQWRCPHQKIEISLPTGKIWVFIILFTLLAARQNKITVLLKHNMFSALFWFLVSSKWFMYNLKWWRNLGQLTVVQETHLWNTLLFWHNIILALCLLYPCSLF